MPGLVRYAVLCVIGLKTRWVHCAGVAPDRHGAWMEQIARNLAEALGIAASGDRAEQPALRLFVAGPTAPARGDYLDEPVAEILGFSLGPEQWWRSG